MSGRNIKLVSLLLFSFFICGVNASRYYLEYMPKQNVESKRKLAFADSSYFYCNNLSQLKNSVSFKLLKQISRNSAIISFDSINKHPKFDLVSVNSDWKLSANIREEDNKELSTYIILSSSIEELKSYLNDIPEIELLHSDESRVWIRTSPQIIRSKLIHLHNVKYIGKEGNQFEPESKIRELDHSVNQIEFAKVKFKDLRGENIHVSVKDSAFHYSDLDLMGKVVVTKLENDKASNHATSMGTIIGGKAYSSWQGKGVATACSLSTSNMNKPYPDDYASFQKYNIEIQNHSYGSSPENFYGSLAQAYDAFIYTHPEILHIYSSGNQGIKKSGHGTYASIEAMANLTGNVKQAKNILCVGAVNQYLEPMNFSSRGPAFDGRIKPELVAFSREGTSNAAALCSGVSVLLKQACEKETGNRASASLLKAILINSATDVFNPGPDYVTGYGNINAYRAIECVKRKQFIVDTLVSGEEIKYTIEVPKGVRNLKLSLVWTDPEASINSTYTLVNDLDVSLVSPLGEKYLPWCLDHSADKHKLLNVAIRRKDQLNNVEQISLNEPKEGEYTIQINASKLQTNQQIFSIAYQYDEDVFLWTSPCENAQYETYEAKVFRWETSLKEKQASLWYSYEESEEWELITDKLDLANLHYEWKPDEIQQGSFRLKMQFDGKSYISSVFSVLPTARLITGLLCDNKIELQWGAIKDVDQYYLSVLEEGEFKLLSSTQDTCYLFETEKSEAPVFSLSYSTKKLNMSRRSLAWELGNQETSCYFKQNYVLYDSEKDCANIEIQLGSTYDLEEMNVYKLEDGLAKLLSNVYAPRKTNFSFDDEDLIHGNNVYRVELKTKAGKSFVSDDFAMYYVKENHVTVFPNPSETSGFTLFMNANDLVNTGIRVYNLSGQLVHKQEVKSDRNYISSGSFKKGLYLYQIWVNGSLRYTGKLVFK